MAQIQSIQVTAPVAQPYCVQDDTITIRVTFSAAVDYTGLRGLKLNTSPVKYATPLVPTASGATYIDFSYTVEAGVTTYRDEVTALALEIDAGHIYNAGTTNNAVLTIVPNTGEFTKIDSIPPTFYYGSHWPDVVKPGDTLNVRFFSSEPVLLPNVWVEGTPDRPLSQVQDWTEHIFTYVVDNADAEGADLVVHIQGTDGADNLTETTIDVPVKIDKQAPDTVPTPTPTVAISKSGFVEFSWDAATDPVYGEDGISHYHWEIMKNGISFLTGETFGPDDRKAELTTNFGDGSNAYRYTCRVKAVDLAERESADWSLISDTCTVDTRRVICDLELTNGDATVNQPFDVDMHFRDALGDPLAVSLPSLAKISVVVGAKGAVTATDGTNANYRFRVTPSRTGTIIIQAALGCAKDAYGRDSYTSNALVAKYDATRPTCKITGPSGPTKGPLVYTVTFSKAVTGFDDTKVTVTGEQSIAVVGSGSVYKVTITPEAARPTTVTIKVAAGVATDVYGNTNLESSTLTATFDDTAPQVVSVSAYDASAGTVFGTGDVVKVQVAFDKPVLADLAKPATLALTLGASVRSAKYIAGSGTNNLIFGYTVASTDPANAAVANGNLTITATNYIKDRFRNLAEATCPTTLASSNLVVNPGFNSLEANVAGVHSNISYTKTETGIVSKFNEDVLRSGVGYGDDLLVGIVSAANENWVPHIHKGWCYYQDREMYLFAEKRTVSTPNYVSDTAVSLNFNKKGYDHTNPFQYGPVIIKGDDVPYTYTSATVRSFGELTTKVEIGTTNNYRFTCPGLPVECYRTDLNEPMRRVPSVEAVQDMNEYYLETVVEEPGGIPTLKHYVIAAGAAKLWCSYLYDTVSDYHSQLEICVVDSQMRIRTMYKDVVSAGTYKPLLRLIEDGVFTEIADASPYQLGNIFTLPETYTRSDAATGTLKPGDRVAIKYWVNHSWILLNGAVRAFHVDTPNPTLTVEYEASLEDVYKADLLVRSSPSYIQLNPLNDGVASGFLYIVDTDTVPYKPAVLRLAAAPAAPTAASDPNKSQPVRVLVRAEDSDGDSVAGTGIVFSSRGEVDFTRGTTNTDVVPIVPQSINGTNITPIYVIYASEPYGTEHHWIINTDYTMTFTNGAWNINWLTAKRPAANAKLTFHFTPALGKYEPNMYVPATQTTDWKGELSAIWRAALGGNRAVLRAHRTEYSQWTQDPLRKETYLWQFSYSDLVTETFSDTEIPKKVFLTLTNESKEPGTVVARAYVTDVTGSYPISANVYFQTQYSRFSIPYPKTVVSNSDGVAENNYHPAAEDVIWAYIVVGGKEIVSNRIYVGGNY